jgi:4-hydroxy-tetrahydrodipicolinate synthase
MTETRLSGVIAAIATAVDENGEPDCARSTALAKFLLDHGCDALNVLGTTGEATSFSTEQRRKLMSAYREAGLPMQRLMVGTGAAAVRDAVELTRHAAELGFAAALLLPPFYYKGVADDGLVAYVEAIVAATKHRPIPVYLYHFPALSGVPWHVGLVARIVASFGNRIAGLKDSSGDLGFARAAAAVAPGFAVFPSNEAALLEARNGPFAGCISATVNLNADLCARAYRGGDAVALEAAANIRKLFDGKPLIAGVKALLGHIHGDPAWARVMPPLTAFSAADRAVAVAGYDSVRVRRVA